MNDWQDAQCAFWDDAVKGSSALRAGILRALRMEVGSATYPERAVILWDAAKFYDSIDIVILIRTSIDVGFPADALYWAVIAYLQPRVGRVGGSGRGVAG